MDSETKSKIVILLTDGENTKGKISGVINISTGETIAVHFFSEIIKNFSLEYPDLQFNIVARKPDSIIDDVLTNKSEIGITFTKEIPKSLKIFSQSNYPVGILCSPRHLLSGKDKVFVEDCIKFPLVFHPGTLTVWKKIQRNMGIKPFTPKPKLIANSFALITSCLAFSLYKPNSKRPCGSNKSLNIFNPLKGSRMW